MRSGLLLCVLCGCSQLTDAFSLATPHIGSGYKSHPRSQHVVAAEDGEVTFEFGDATGVSSDTTEELETEVRELTEKEKEIARLKAAEKFMLRDTGDAVCSTCDFKYKMETGDGTVPRNTPFEILPDSYVCPNCKSPKAFFKPVQVEIAGFADNQNYGLGTNTWTESQKSTAIFGGLAAFFLVFLAGYGLN